jgi:hypothetical protein
MEVDNKNKKGVSRREFIRSSGLGAAAIVGSSTIPTDATQAQQNSSGLPQQWDIEADVVVIGSGPTGLLAALRARDAGASVLIVEANYDSGGHGVMNGGTIQLGGGTRLQKKYGVEDDPETYFRDLIDWTVVESNGVPDYRYNDRALMHTLAYNSVATFDYMEANGVRFEDIPPTVEGAHGTGLSAPRAHEVTYAGGPGAESPRGDGGTGIYRPLEITARNKGVKFLFNYHMDVIYREQPQAGRVLGIQASFRPRFLPGQSTSLQSFHSNGNIDMSIPNVTVKANKAIVIGTGGSTGNVEFRRMFDPRMTDVYQLAAGLYSDQDGSGEMAAIAIGASLWGTGSHVQERNGYFRKRNIIGSQYTYVSWVPESILFPLAGATGLRLRDWSNVVLVNQVGKRFYSEDGDNWPYGTRHGHLDPYVREDWRNIRRTKYDPKNFLDAALAPNEGSEPPDYAAGPIWAIFDSEAVTREKWDLSPPATKAGYFFSADTLEELATKVTDNPYQRPNMPPDYLAATIKRYNEIVDMGHDPDFERTNPKYKIAKPPFYAAWATPVIHDCYVGLRINMQCQVQDMKGQVIQGLYCGGESAGGSSQHGQGRCVIQGYVAGAYAAQEPEWG